MTKGVLRNFTKFIGRRLCQSLFFNKVAGWHLSYRTPPDDCFCFILFHSVMAETFIINETPFIKFYRTFEWKSASVNITVNIQLTTAFILKKFSKFDSFKWKSSKLNVSNEKLVNFWMKKQRARLFWMKK